MSELSTLIHASAHHLPMIADKSVQCVVTSPPYFGLRKYDGAQDIEWSEVSYSPMAGLPPITIAGCKADCEHEWGALPERKNRWGEDTNVSKKQATQKGNAYALSQGAYCQKCGGWRGGLGNEPTIEAYIGHLILCAREWRRCLADDGVMWVNLGDSYSTQQAGNKTWGDGVGSNKHYENGGIGLPPRTNGGIPNKNLMMIPARFALAAQADGWVLRSEVIWHKPNPMPESVTDRPTKAHEQIYLLAKSERYFYDHEAVKEPQKAVSLARLTRGVSDNHKNINGAPGQTPHTLAKPRTNDKAREADPSRNLRTVWTIATQPYSQAHFAAFPPSLVEPMIKAGSKVGDTVLDPFGGSQTTGKVAIKLGRKYIGVDLSEKYLDELAPERLTVQMELIA